MEHSRANASSWRQCFANHAEWFWAPLFYILAVVYLYSEVLAGDQGFGWDTIESYWPDLVFVYEEWSQGNWPKWNPYDRGGYPIAADPQPGMYYPIHWLLLPWRWIAGDSGWSLIQFKMLMHHALAGMCMHLYLRHRKMPSPVALLGGIILIASTPWLIHKASNLLLPMVWTPLVWLSIDRILRRPSPANTLLLAFAVYLGGSAGSPPGFFYLLLMAVLYGLFRAPPALWKRRKHPKRALQYTHLCLALFGAAFIAIGLLWVGVAPAMELSEHTPRVNRNLAYAVSLPLQMWPTLRALFVPTAGQVDAYCGVLALLLAFCALAKPTRDSSAPLFFFTASALFLALSFGKALPFLPWLVEHIPGFGLFRISSRYKCLFAPMLSVAAAYGALHLWERSKERKTDFFLILGISLIFLSVVFYIAFKYPLPVKLEKRFPSSGTHFTLAILGTAMVIASAWHAPRARKWIIAAMPLLALGDSEKFWHHKSIFLEKNLDHQDDASFVAALEGVPDMRWRIYDEFVLGQRPGSRLSIRDFRGYPSGDPLDFQRYRDILKRASKHPELLEAYNVRYILHAPHHRSAKRSNWLKRDPALGTSAHYKRTSVDVEPKGKRLRRKLHSVREALHPVPLVAWYGAAKLAPTSKILSEVLASEQADGTRRHVVLEKKSAAALKQSSLLISPTSERQLPPSQEGRLLHFSTDKVVFEIDAPSDGIVVLNEIAYPGWEVMVDGVEATSLRANYVLRAVELSAGVHRVEWSFTPKGHTKRLLLYWLCLATLLGGALFVLISRYLRHRGSAILGK